MNNPQSVLPEQLSYLPLTYFKEHYQTLADQAAREQWPPVEYLGRLVEGETALRRDRATARRVHAARFPVIKNLEEFQWTWPKKINRAQVQQLFRLQFIAEKKNLILLGGVGLGIMPGAGSCRAVCNLPMNGWPERLAARHNPRHSYRLLRNCSRSSVGR